VIASQHYPTQQILSGLSVLLGDVPILGFSTPAEITSQGQDLRTVVVALFSSNDIQARADWWPGFYEDSRAATQRMNQSLQLYQSTGNLLLIGDGIASDARQLCAALPSGSYNVAGCLSGGELRLEWTFQLGGKQAGTGGLSAALLTGKIALGIGIAHGLQPVGAYFKVTRARGAFVHTLDGQPAAEAYARLLGYTATEWTQPPLNELARLYPLGIERSSQEDLMVRAPLWMENDFSLRTNTAVAEGSIAHLLVGSAESYIQAAKEAAQQARQNLGTARPVLALVLADISWQMILQSQPGAEVTAIREILGADIPLIGGYTFGQISKTPQPVSAKSKAEMYNQHIEVVLFGEPTE
jgi:hypothetical protein